MLTRAFPHLCSQPRGDRAALGREPLAHLPLVE
jgi:hypothetical protein